MNTLYHFHLCPFSRKVRVFLNEKNIEYDLVEENFWERNIEFAELNPAMEVPVLRTSSNLILPDSNVICEYLDEKFTQNNLIGKTAEEKAEIRRISYWFDIKFFGEVTKYLLYEKIIAFLEDKKEPNSKLIRVAKANMGYHLDYISFLRAKNTWLAGGDKLSLADISAAAQISIIDYLNEIPWRHYPKVKEWYSVVKSRPSFRSVLSDYVTGFMPPEHYANLDF